MAMLIDPGARAPTIDKILRYGVRSSGGILAVSIAALLISFVLPFALQALIDRVLVFNAASTLIVIFVVLLVAGVLEGAAMVLRGRLLNFKSGEVSSQIGALVVEKALRQPALSLLGITGRKTMEAVTEISYFRDAIAELLLYGIQLFFAVFFYLLVIFLINPSMTWVVLATIPFHVALYWALTRMAKSRVRRAIGRTQEFGSSLHSAVGSIETIYAYGLASRQADVSRKLMFDAFFFNYQARNSYNAAQAASRVLSRATEALVVFLGAQAVMLGEMTLGQLVMFQMLLTRLIQPLSQFGDNWDRLFRVRTHLDRWREMLEKAERAPKGGEAMSGAGPVLNAAEASFTYPGANAPAVQNISLLIEAGEIVFVLGPSGSGKSTFVRLISGLVEPTTGSIRISGADPARVREEDRRRLTASVFQEAILLPGTVAENIAAFDPHTDFATIEAAARAAGALAFIQALPEGFDTQLGISGYSISGGERQRVCLARMLAARAALMVIDEGTSGLQRSLEVEVIENIKASMSPNQALIIITHREDLVHLGTRSIRLDGGQIVTDSPAPQTRLLNA
jgi:ATP-binding cassette subfamily B protein RtxB